MFEFKIPTLEDGPADREILTSFRDAAIVEQRIRYGNFSNGIISGCQLFEDNMTIGVLDGIVKYAGRLYILKDKVGVRYQPTDAWTVLKIRFGSKIAKPYFELFRGQLVLDEKVELLPNEIELGRFKLKTGSRLRTNYQNFRDLMTEYDTVNLLHVQHAMPDVATLSPVITTFFGQEAYEKACEPLDVAFCTECLNGAPVRRELILRYLCKRLGKSFSEMTNTEIHLRLSDILDDIIGRSKVKTNRPQKGGMELVN